MKFALFYEIPVPRPWERRQRARRLPEHARAGDRGRPLRLARLLDRRAPLPAGVLALLEPRGALRRHRGAHRAHPPRLRRAPHAQALQPPGAHGRVGGRARPALGRPGRPRDGALGDPGRARGLRHRPGREPRACGRRRSGTSSGAGPTTSTSSRASTGRCPGGGCSPSRWQKPHPPLWGATTSDEGHAQVGELGLGLCSFAVGLPPAEVKRKIDIYRDAVERCTTPIGAFVHNQAATFTMAICAPDRDEAIADGARVLRVVPQDRRPPDRHAHRLDGRAQRGASAPTPTRPT